MWENTVAIHSILKAKNYKAKFLTSSILKNKIKGDNFGENHKKTKTKKTMLRNIVAINNVLKKKITKLSSQSAQYKKIDKYNFEKIKK